jgi:Na+-driven multidrug efflux pump
MLTLAFPKLKVVYDSWKRILYIGIPTALTRIVVPLGIGVITRIISSYGSEAVAGYGVATRIQFFSMTAIRALASVIGPFVGQNWGARKYERIDQGIAKSRNFSLIWGLGVCAVLAVVARPIALIFNDNAMVVSTTTLFLRIVPLSYAFFGITILSFSVLNVLNKPLHAALLGIMQMILFVALALLGSYLLGITGVFVASAAAYCIAGIGSYFVLRIVVNAIKKSGETT